MLEHPPFQTQSIQAVQKAAHRLKKTNIADLFRSDQARFDKFSLRAGNLLLDYSKNLVDQQALEALANLAKEMEVPEALKAQLQGWKVNQTENRAALHTVLRNPESAPEESIQHQVEEGQAQMKAFSQKLHSGNWRGYTGKPVTDVVHIGIGGSYLGPEMVTKALHPYRLPGIQVHFVANVDGTALQQTLADLNPETTLFIIASKSFTTQETLTNAHSAREWFFKNGGTQSAVQHHFVAVSTNVSAATEFGIAQEQVFPFGDWVGGRFSVWSTVGLPVVAQVGFDQFQAFLEGAKTMDQHAVEQDILNNMPALLAMLSFWYGQFFSSAAEAVLPYDANLAQFPDHLQQLLMESNGKQTDRQGYAVEYPTQPVVFGGAGTNVQHSFFQLLHQGTALIPCDFLVPANPPAEQGDHHEKLLANALAQPEALMMGKSYQQVVSEMRQDGADEATIQAQAPYRTFPGNRPSNTLLYSHLTPYTLGNLLALYEHKTAMLGYLLHINSFDQWGVELGKSLAKSILPELQNAQTITGHDASTNGLINTLKHWRSER